MTKQESYDEHGDRKRKEDRQFITRASLVLAFAVMGVMALGMWGCPTYNVWEQGLVGEAALARAEQDRQIRVREAQAKLESATFERQAEVERARGVAEAIEQIQGKLDQKYLRYRYILMLEETGGQGRETIYVPTEAGIPILEAGRLSSGN